VAFETGELHFQKKENESDPLKVAGTLSLRSPDDPVIVSKAVTFATVADDGTETIVGRAILPGFAPAGAK
jgi:hypothetical protein